MRAIVGVLVGIVLIIAVSAYARVKLIDIEELPALADFIIIGTVSDSESAWDDQGIMINTHYTIDVNQNIKGETGHRIVMRFAGGTVNGQTITVTHTPVLDVGEKYLIFGYENNRYSVPVVGHEQGLFRIVSDKTTGQEMVVDYNWYHLERTSDGRMIRGSLTKLDEKGSLNVCNVEEIKRIGMDLKPVVRDIRGEEINQDNAVFEKPAARKRGTPATRSDFVSFITSLINPGGDNK